MRDEGSEVVNMRRRRKSGSSALFTQNLCVLSRCYWWKTPVEYEAALNTCVAFKSSLPGLQTGFVARRSAEGRGRSGKLSTPHSCIKRFDVVQILQVLHRK